MNLSHIQAMHQEAQQARRATFQARTATNGHLTVSESLRRDIDALRRSGGLDSSVSEQVAVKTLASLYHIGIPQAWDAWISFAATTEPK